MERFYRRALDILEIAASPGAGRDEQWIVCDAGNRVMQLLTGRHGWSLPALAAETGGSAVFRIDRRSGRAVVEGWWRGGSCSLSRELGLNLGPDTNQSSFHSVQIRPGAFPSGAHPHKIEVR